MRDRQRLLASVLALVLCPPAPAAAAAAGDEEAGVVHVLNRLGYGPRPGDIESVRAAGLRSWIERQLHPERIPDRALEARLAPLRTLRLSTAEIFEGYGLPREAKREIKERKDELGNNPSEEDIERTKREFVEKYAQQMQGRPNEVLDELQVAKLIRAVHAERQLDEVLVDFWMNHFNVYGAKGVDRYLITAYERDVIRPRAWGKFEDLLRATAESPAMLFYLDNWLSSDPKAAAEAAGKPRERKRGKRVPGTFRPVPRYGTEAQEKQREADEARLRRSGLNEKYARELMELHTLGVDGGYTQKDVSEVARCFTGWTIRGLHEGEPRFAFERRIHDSGDKLVLGTPIRRGDKDEGERVLRMLATHPSTARFIALKLARRFVSDQPPPALVERAAERFRSSHGEIREVVRVIVESPEFLAPDARGAKVKTPLEFVASALRAAGAELESSNGLAQSVAEMGMPLYLQQPPTGYKDTADAWVSTSGLLARLNFALDLAAGKLPGVRVRPEALAGPPGAASGSTEALVARLLPGGLSETTRTTLAEQGGDASPTRLAGLILGSPEFQRK